jgi:hypothetical protein
MCWPSCALWKEINDKVNNSLLHLVSDVITIAGQSHTVQCRVIDTHKLVVLFYIKL